VLSIAIAAAVVMCCRKEVEEEPDPAQIAKDMERLAMIKKKRYAQHVSTQATRPGVRQA
jgi:hypothetical protein